MILVVIASIVGLFLGAGGAVVYEQQSRAKGKAKRDKEVADASR